MTRARSQERKIFFPMASLPFVLIQNFGGKHGHAFSRMIMKVVYCAF